MHTKSQLVSHTYYTVSFDIIVEGYSLRGGCQVGELWKRRFATQLGILINSRWNEGQYEIQMVKCKRKLTPLKLVNL